MTACGAEDGAVYERNVVAKAAVLEETLLDLKSDPPMVAGEKALGTEKDRKVSVIYLCVTSDCRGWLFIFFLPSICRSRISETCVCL